MTGKEPDHYVAANLLLGAAAEAHQQSGNLVASTAIQIAQVHATLALVDAVKALGPSRSPWAPFQSR